ncbi:MAG: alpha-1,2-fucosyltransferase [Patescibacteria group bacterium]
MIIVKLTGGLGNQMFQYAIGRALAEKNKTELKLDISWFNHIKKNTTPRKYELGIFNIVEKIANNDEIKKLKKYKKINNWKYLFYNLFFSDNSIYITEKPNNFNKKILENSNKDIYLDGYWQNEKYFSAQDGFISNGKNIKNIIREEFTLKNEFSIKNQKLKGIIENTNSISIHIRRSDYINNKKTNKIYEICSLDYYQNAIQKISEKFKDLKIFVFSDDIWWAKENFKTEFSITFVEENKNYEDLILMSLCKHNVIANSSFSWWGAWLNPNPDKIVIAPEKWFTDLEKNKYNPIPLTWMKI